MNKFLNDIRSAENSISGNRKIINTIAVLFLGIAFGLFSKFLDFHQAELPSVFMAIDGAVDCLLYTSSVTEADWKFEPCLAREGSSGPDWQNILSNQALYV